jgi:hypothetical protein
VKGRVTLLMLAAVVALACGDSAVPALPPDPRSVQPVPPPPSEQLEEATILVPGRRDLLQKLSGARTQWRGAAPHEYRLTVAKECFCDRGTPFQSHVRGIVVVSGTGGVRSRGIGVEPALRTVESLFTETERLIRSNADEVTVVFAPRLGYPARISVDRWRNAVDDEWTWATVLTSLD